MRMCSRNSVMASGGSHNGREQRWGYLIHTLVKTGKKEYQETEELSLPSQKSCHDCSMFGEMDFFCYRGSCVSCQICINGNLGIFILVNSLKCAGLKTISPHLLCGGVLGAVWRNTAAPQLPVVLLLHSLSRDICTAPGMVREQRQSI